MRRTLFKIDKLEFDPIEFKLQAHKAKGQPLLDYMTLHNIPWTWSNWLRLAWGEGALKHPPDALRGAEALAEVPEEFLADIELFLMTADSRPV
jgi:hypothetical protein